MNELTLESLERRFARLEWQNRLWKRCAVCVVVMLASIIIVGATTEKVANELRAKRFVLIDEDGKTVAQFAMARGLPAIDLYNIQAKGRMSLYPSGWVVVSRDNTPKKMVDAVLDNHTLTLSDLGGHLTLAGMGAVSLEGGPGASPFLSISTNDGKKVVWTAQ